MLSEFKFTIFTATYNRVNTLHRVYESLKAQTYRNFEWLIIDDGSTDNTFEQIKKWQDIADFPIRYYYQENQGKHIAFNYGVEKARGLLFLFFDSDDACEPNALERLLFHWENIPESERDKFTGVTCLCKTPEGKIIGSKFPQNITDCTLLQMMYSHRIISEQWAFHRTDVLKQYPFPTEFKKTYIAETVVWSAIGRKYYTRFVNEPLRIYFVDSEDSLVNRKIPDFKNQQGGVFARKKILNRDIDFFWYHPYEFIRTTIHYTRFSCHTNIPIVEQFRGLTTYSGKSLWLLTFIISYCVYLKDCLYLRINLLRNSNQIKL